MTDSVPAAEHAAGSPYSRHMPALDGLRGLAILFVMSSHLFPGTPHNLAQSFLLDTLGFGATGVDLFFVLSGFLITGILVDSQNDAPYFRNFYARRALRIFPLYYGVLLTYTFVSVLKRCSTGGELGSLALYLQNTSLLAPPGWLYHGALPLPLTHFWSLAVEEQFYLFWPLLVFLLRTRSRLLIVCAASVILCPLLRFALWTHGASFSAVNANTLCRADALLLGGALALWLRRAPPRALAWMPWLTMGLLGVLLLRFVNSARAASGAPTSRAAAAALALNYTVISLGYLGLLRWALLPGSLAVRLFSLSSLRLLGRYSYGLYVLHLLLLYYLAAPVRSLLGDLAVPRSLVAPLTGLTLFGLSFAAAFTSYQLYERPFLRLKRFFGPRTSPPSARSERSSLAQATAATAVSAFTH